MTQLTQRTIGERWALGLLALQSPELVRSIILGEPPILPWLSRSDIGDSLRRVPALGALLRAAFAMRLEMRADPDAYMPAVSCREVAGIMTPVLLVEGQQSPQVPGHRGAGERPDRSNSVSSRAYPGMVATICP